VGIGQADDSLADITHLRLVGAGMRLP
jgi:hypothetical protein